MGADRAGGTGEGREGGPARASIREIFRVALRLGLTSFGGPVAHLGYFREEYVIRRGWLDERAYADLVALCQFLPGPASSQVGMGIGLKRGGVPGAVAAWLGFTLPSALALMAFGYGMSALPAGLGQGWLHGLKVVAVAVVAQAVWGMGRKLCPDIPRAAMAAAACAGVLAWPAAPGQMGVIVLGGVGGWLWLKPASEPPPAGEGIRIGQGATLAGLVALALFAVLLAGLPLAAALLENQFLAVADSFYRVGALVFGGGHVVLPLLQAEVVLPGWVTPEAFVAGYGAAQAVPGPLFTFSAYLGTVMTRPPTGWLGAVVALVSVFLPSFLLVTGVMPFWERLRRFRGMQSALMGVNAAVVGLLLAALYRPVWTSAIHSAADVGLGLAAFALLVRWRLPAWLVVGLSAAGGAALAALGAGQWF